MQIDISQDRELLGLNKDKALLPAPLKFLLIAVITVVMSCYAAMLLANANNIHHRIIMHNLIVQIYAKFDPQEIRPLITEIQNNNKFTTQDQLTVAQAYSYAADVLPDRNKWLYAAKNVLININLATQNKNHYATLLLSAIETDLGNYNTALNLLNESKELFQKTDGSYSSYYYNQLAYITASNPASSKSTVQQALATMQDNVINLPENQLNSEFLDTLAECHYASGNPQQALTEQRKALALAKRRHLWVFLKHFKKYQNSLNK